MDTVNRFVLKHKEKKLYFSRFADLTSKLGNAWRFLDEEQVEIFLQVHSYAPEREYFDIVPIELIYKEVEKNV